MSEISQSRHKPTTLDLLQQLRGERADDAYRQDIAEDYPHRLEPPSDNEVTLREADRIVTEAEFKRQWDANTHELEKEQLTKDKQLQAATEAGQALVKASLA